jgi:hypothetical protein
VFAPFLIKGASKPVYSAGEVCANLESYPQAGVLRLVLNNSVKGAKVHHNYMNYM